MRNLPNLIYLQAFEAAARHMSFTDAAAELGCTQAAISQRVRGLEEQLKRKLFERRSNGIVLTETGEAYLPGISEALNLAAGATESLQGRSALRAVTISAPTSFLSHWLMPRLGVLQAEVPDMALRMNSSIWTDPNVELADIAIEVREDNEAEPHLPRLQESRITLVAAPELAARMGPAPAVSALQGLVQFDVQGRYGLWSRWAEAMEVTLDRQAVVVKVDTASAALEAVRLGLGVTVVHASYCHDMLRDGRLCAPFGAGLPSSLRHCLIRPIRQKPRWHPAHAVYDWMEAAFTKSGSN